MYYGRRTEDGQLPPSRALGPHKRSLFSRELTYSYQISKILLLRRYVETTRGVNACGGQSDRNWLALSPTNSNAPNASESGSPRISKVSYSQTRRREGGILNRWPAGSIVRTHANGVSTSSSSSVNSLQKNTVITPKRLKGNVLRISSIA